MHGSSPQGPKLGKNCTYGVLLCMRNRRHAALKIARDLLNVVVKLRRLSSVAAVCAFPSSLLGTL